MGICWRINLAFLPIIKSISFFFYLCFRKEAHTHSHTKSRANLSLFLFYFLQFNEPNLECVFFADYACSSVNQFVLVSFTQFFFFYYSDFVCCYALRCIFTH